MIKKSADGKIIYHPEKCVQCDTCIHVCPHDSSPRTAVLTPEETYKKVKNNGNDIKKVMKLMKLKNEIKNEQNLNINTNISKNNTSYSNINNPKFFIEQKSIF